MTAVAPKPVAAAVPGAPDVAFPLLTAALFGLLADRLSGAHVVQKCSLLRPSSRNRPAILPWPATASPRFKEPPRIRSERPAFDLHYPHAVEDAHRDKYVGVFSGKHKATVPDAPSDKLSHAIGGLVRRVGRADPPVQHLPG